MIYRDTKTGRFAARAAWRRSKAHDGTRYVRERPAPPKRKRKAPALPLPPKRKRRITTEYVLHFDGRSGSDKDRNRTPIVDVQVHLTGLEVEDAEIRRIYKTWWEESTLPRGWKVKAIAWERKGKSESGDPKEIRQWLGFSLHKRPIGINRT
jgi:hypothetical protein